MSIDYLPAPKPEPVSAYRPFPTRALPPAMRRLVAEAARAFGCDAGFVAPPALTVLAAAVGLSMRAVVKRTWVEPAAVWTGLLADSGSMKTPVLEVITAPIEALQRVAWRTYRDDRDAYDAELADLKSRPKADRGEPPAEPQLADIVMKDCTIESVAAAMLRHPRGLLVIRDELSGFFGGIGRYGNGRAEGDAASWLELSRASSIKRNRSASPTAYVPRALASITGTTQPGTFKRCLSAGGIDQISNGMMGRFLWTHPTPPSDYPTDDDVSDDAADGWDALVRRVYALPCAGTPEEPEPHDVRLTPEAQALRGQWQIHIADRRRELRGDDGQSAMLAALAKLRGAAVRLALVVHAARVATGDADLLMLDAEAMTAGVTLAEWFVSEAERVYGMASESAGQSHLRLLAEKLRRDYAGDVSVRDWQRRHHRRLTNTDDARQELSLLADAGHGELYQPPQAGRGRPGERFRLLVASDSAGDSGATGDGDKNSDSGPPAVFLSPSPLSPPVDAKFNGYPPPAAPRVPRPIRGVI